MALTNRRIQTEQSHDYAPTRQAGPPLQVLPHPYLDARFTRCPMCEAKMRQKKLPLVIHIDDWGTVILNKTCRFCPGCQLLILHQDQLEAYLVAFLRRAGARGRGQ